MWRASDNLRTNLRAAAWAAAIQMIPLAYSTQAQCYDVEVIPVWNCGALGEETLFGEDMNESGQVAGWQFNCFTGPDVPAAWFGGPQLTTLPLPDSIAWHARATGINDEGAVVGGGMLSDSAGNGHAFLVIDGKPTDLGTLPGDNDSGASDLNDSLQIVGSSRNTSEGGPISAVLWEGGEIVALDLPFGTNAKARAINQSGEIVGWMGSSSVLDAHAFLWTNSGVIDLGVIPSGFTADATAINNTGAVVGAGVIPQQNGTSLSARGFYWTNSVMIDLGTLPGFTHRFAHDVNDGHVIAGECTELGKFGAGWVWRNGVMTDLNDLIDPALEIIITQADAINNAGQILVRGNTPDRTRTLILTPKNPSPTDLTADCVTDMTDLMALLEQWGSKPPPGGADFNADGVVGPADLAQLLANWS